MKYCSILLLFLSACSSGVSSGQTPDVQENTPRLISWTHAFVMEREEDDFSYYHDHENFIRKYFSVDYQENQMVATTLIEVNCIDSIAGRIEVSNDTIYLKRDILMTDDRLCSEFHTFTFTISNPENKRYKVVSLK